MAVVPRHLEAAPERMLFQQVFQLGDGTRVADRGERWFAAAVTRELGGELDAATRSILSPE